MNTNSNDTSSLEKIRHSLSHIMTAVIQERFPTAKLGVGPAIENGFYQDYDLLEKLSDEDLPTLEKRMKQLVKQNLVFESTTMTKKEALTFYKNDPYKTELINEHYPDDSIPVQFYKIADSLQLCRGGHVESTKEINPKAFKLTTVAGAYWRGKESNTMLTRIYGLAFESAEDLEKHLKMLREARERDHRKLGRELDLFTFSELVGAGLPLWTPKGTILRHELTNYVWELRKKFDYQQVTIPHITKKELYETSGHWEKFKNDLFKIETREEHIFAMKPMNCPHHTQIFARKLHSYREMPQRYSETTMVYRDEQSGELSGLARVLSITQDDAHVFCRRQQVKDEANKIWSIVENFYGAFGFSCHVRLSLHDPENFQAYLGKPETWRDAEQQLRELIQDRGATFTEAVGEAAFYGPKIDFMSTDALGREWQVATIQLDVNMPDRFNLFCINEEGQEERIVMIHAAIMGAVERFVAIMLEHTNGNLPLWASPTHIKLLPVGADHRPYCQELAEQWRAQGLRVDVDESDETVGKKIRNAASEKTPYILVIGEKEMASQELSLRIRGQEDMLHISREDFLKHIKDDISSHTSALING